jgi:hypothetical protein
VLVTMLLGGLWQRRTLRANPFHRNLWDIIVVTVGQNLAQRLLGVALGIPTLRLFPFEMVVFAGSAALMSLIMSCSLPPIWSPTGYCHWCIRRPCSCWCSAGGTPRRLSPLTAPTRARGVG